MKSYKEFHYRRIPFRVYPDRNANGEIVGATVSATYRGKEVAVYTETASAYFFANSDNVKLRLLARRRAYELIRNAKGWNLLFRDSEIIKRGDGKYNLLGENGEPVSETWFDSIDDFSDGMAFVEKDGRRGLLGRDGKLIAGMWFDYVSRKTEAPRKVYLNKAFNYLSPSGEFLYDEWMPLDQSYFK